jgi:hypothetical protein
MSDNDEIWNRIKEKDLKNAEKYEEFEVKTIEDLDNLITKIMINDGPDGHCDGSLTIAKAIWDRVEKWRTL